MDNDKFMINNDARIAHKNQVKYCWLYNSKSFF
jgi:hypothetical protein